MSSTTVCFRHEDAVDLFFGRNGTNFGGAETQIYLLAELIARQPEYDSLFLTNKDVPGRSETGVHFSNPRKLIQRGLPFIARGINHRRLHAPFEGCDRVVLFQTIAGVNTLEIFGMSKQLGFPFISRISSDADIDGSLVAPDKRQQYFDALRSAGAVIAQSVRQKERLLTELGIDAHVVPSLVSPGKKASHDGPGYILWVGRKVSLKRPWIAVETARKYPKYRFVIVGPDYDALLSDALLDEARSLENLTFLPEVPFHEMPGYFQNASLLIGTSLIEGFPNVYLQAAAHGVPVVSLSVPTSIYPEHAGCGFSAHGDIWEFWATIERLMGDDELRREAGLAAYDYVQKEHSPHNVERLLLPILDVVADGG